MQHSFTVRLLSPTMTRSAYLPTKPVPLTSIFLKRDMEKNDGSLQTSLVTDLNSDMPKKELVNQF